MFWWVFVIAWIALILLLLFLEGMARNNASGPGEPVNWWSTIGWAGGGAIVLALVFQGLVSLFS